MGAGTPTPNTFTSFVLTLSVTRSGGIAIGGDATSIMPPSTGRSPQGSVHFEQWDFFAYDAGFYLDALYTNPNAGYGDLATIVGNLAVELLEIEGRPAP